MRCRREAYALFKACASDLDAPGALCRGAVALAMHECEDADPKAVEEKLDALAGDVQLRVMSPSPTAYLAHLHAVLFDEEGFRGETENYYDPRNSYVHCVLDRRRGLPITLCLIYREVATRVGLVVDGVNAPGHFMAAVENEGARMLVDPFDRGRAMTREEAFVRIDGMLGREVPRDDKLLAPATPRQWLARMLQNLLNIFNAQGRGADVEAMLELRELLA